MTTPVYAKGVQNSGANIATLAFAALTPSVLGECLVIPMFSTGLRTIVSIVDNLGQTWTDAIAANTNTHCVYKENSAAGVTSVTVTFSSASILMGAYMRFNDLLASGAFDKASTQRDETAVTTATTNTTAAMAQDKTLGIGLFGSSNGSTKFTGPGSGWTALTGTGISGGTVDDVSDGDSSFYGLKDYTAGGTAFALAACDTAANPHSRVLLFKVADATRRKIAAAMMN